MKTKIGNRGYSYIRISKDVQDSRSQHDAIGKWLTAKSLSVIDTIEDSGSRDLAHKRPGFQRLMAKVQNGEVDFIVVAERDRFGAADLWEYASFIHTLRTHRCKLYCAADDKELTATSDRIEPFMATITSDRSRSEQEARGQREHRSKMAHVKRGAWPGGKPPFGYDLVCREDATGRELWRLAYEAGQHKRLCTYADGSKRRFDGKHNTPKHNRGETVYVEISKDAVAVRWVKKIFEWFADGFAYRGIASRLNEANVPAIYTPHWLGATIKCMLRNPIYVTGVPTWNKAAHGRFIELVNGEWLPVERDAGRVKSGRKRNESDYVAASPNPDNAIIDQKTWHAVQTRIRSLEVAPKQQRRPKNAELFLAGLVVCGDCNEPMVGWSQHSSYKCGTNSRYKGKCRCNKTRHSIVEALVVKYLEDAGKSLELFKDDPESAWELVELSLKGEPLIDAFNREFRRMVREAKAKGYTPPRGGYTYSSLRSLLSSSENKGREDQLARIALSVQEKEKERGRLVKRLGLLEDDDAAKVVADRIAELTAELKELKEKAKPSEDRADVLRDQVIAILEQTEQTRKLLAESLPRQKGEAVRGVIGQIIVRHEERRMGKLRASRLVGVEIVPTFRDVSWRGRD